MLLCFKVKSMKIHQTEFWFSKTIKKKHLLFLLFLSAAPLSALEIDPFSASTFIRDDFTISFFREEKPSFYWVNAGVPNVFFQGVSQTVTSPLAYAVNGIEYGVGASGWLTDQIQASATIPFEANSLQQSSAVTTSSESVTHSLEKLGDIELDGTFLFVGNRKKGNFIGFNGWVCFATGSNPFSLAYPLLSTGKGANREAFGVVLGQQAGGFSFFQSINYEKTDSITLSPTSLFGAGTFQWPDNWFTAGRVEYQAFHRAQRLVSFFYELRLRKSGFMKMNNQVVFYGGEYGDNQARTTDLLFDSSLGMDVRVDKTFSALIKLTDFPDEWADDRPNQGVLFSLSLVFRPL